MHIYANIRSQVLTRSHRVWFTTTPASLEKKDCKVESQWKSGDILVRERNVQAQMLPCSYSGTNIALLHRQAGILAEETWWQRPTAVPRKCDTTENLCHRATTTNIKTIRSNKVWSKKDHFRVFSYISIQCRLNQWQYWVKHAARLPQNFTLFSCPPLFTNLGVANVYGLRFANLTSEHLLPTPPWNMLELLGT